MEMSLKNILLAGIGSIALTYEKSESVINELVRKGELTVNQGKELNEELREKMDKNKSEKEESNTLTIETLKEVLSNLNLATKQDLIELEKRIDKLENK